MKLSLLIFLLHINYIYAEDLKDYQNYCIKGAAITESALNKSNENDSKRIILRCVGGTKRTLQDYKKEKNKASYGCGVGIGVALNFHNQNNLLKSNSFLSNVLNQCLK